MFDFFASANPDKKDTIQIIKQKTQTNKALHNVQKELLRAGDLRVAVKQPGGYKRYDWLSTNTVDFYNAINALYGTLTQYCSEGIESCKHMIVGTHEYLWRDEDTNTVTQMAAPQYINKLLDKIKAEISNSQIFPDDEQIEYPSNFEEKILKDIFRRLFRIYAHIYQAHNEQCHALGMSPHLNTSFKHFMLFVFEFHLIPEKELAPLEDLLQNMFPADYEAYVPRGPRI